MVVNRFVGECANLPVAETLPTYDGMGQPLLALRGTRARLTGDAHALGLKLTEWDRMNSPRDWQSGDEWRNWVDHLPATRGGNRPMSAASVVDSVGQLHLTLRARRTAESPAPRQPDYVTDMYGISLNAAAELVEAMFETRERWSNDTAAVHRARSYVRLIRDAVESGPPILTETENETGRPR